MGLSFKLTYIFDTQVFVKSTVLIDKWIIVRELHARMFRPNESLDRNDGNVTNLGLFNT